MLKRFAPPLVLFSFLDMQGQMSALDSFTMAARKSGLKLKPLPARLKHDRGATDRAWRAAAMKMLEHVELAYEVTPKSDPDDLGWGTKMAVDFPSQDQSWRNAAPSNSETE